MALTLDNYFAHGWRDQTHTCAACEWQGSARQMPMELHEDEAQFDCPQCENPILLVVHPSLAQVQAAADAGHGQYVAKVPCQCAL